MPLDVWQHTIDVNLTGYMYGIRHALPIMIGQKSGSIINTMSSAVWMGEPERVAYQASKSGLVGLTRHAATLGGKHGVPHQPAVPRRHPHEDRGGNDDRGIPREHRRHGALPATR